MEYYDDHDYCEACGRHARTCWCWTGRAEIGLPGKDDCPGGVGHDGYEVDG